MKPYQRTRRLFEAILAVAVIVTALVTAARLLAHGQMIYQNGAYVDTAAPNGTPRPTHTPDPQDCQHGDHTGDPHCPTATPTPTNTPVEPTPTPTEVCARHCDCDGNGQVTIGEVIRAVNMFLGDPDGCASIDVNHDNLTSIGEVVQCVNEFLGQCDF